MTANKLDIVTIDGPAGVGKSKVSRILANRLGFFYFDSGAIYRSVALKSIDEGIGLNELSDPVCLYSFLINLNIFVFYGRKGNMRIFINGSEIGDRIRSPDVNAIVGDISELIPVQEKLIAVQHGVCKQGRVVVEGRGLGEFVFPGARWKFYLDAISEERARRRTNQLRKKGFEASEEEILEQIIQRDRMDMNRRTIPLVVPKDSFRIDSTFLSADQVVDEMFALIELF